MRTFVILRCRRLQCGIGTTACHSSPPVILKTLTEISCGVRKDELQQSTLTQCTLFFFSGASCFGTHLAYNFFNKCFVTLLFNKERGIYGKLLLAQLTIKFDRRYALYIQILYHWLHFTVGGSCNKSLHLQPLQRCYCENSGSPASACIITQSLHAINGLIAVGQMGNSFCWRPSYNRTCITSKVISITLYTFIPFQDKTINCILEKNL